MVSIAIQGLIPAIKEKIGFDCPNLAALARILSSMETQFKYARFDRPQKVNNVGYEFDLELVDSSDEEVENDEVDILSQQIWFLLHFQKGSSRYSPLRELRKLKQQILQGRYQLLSIRRLRRDKIRKLVNQTFEKPLKAVRCADALLSEFY